MATRHGDRRRHLVRLFLATTLMHAIGSVASLKQDFLRGALRDPCNRSWFRDYRVDNCLGEMCGPSECKASVPLTWATLLVLNSHLCRTNTPCSCVVSPRTALFSLLSRSEVDVCCPSAFVDVCVGNCARPMGVSSVAVGRVEERPTNKERRAARSLHTDHWRNVQSPGDLDEGRETHPIVEGHVQDTAICVRTRGRHAVDGSVVFRVAAPGSSSVQEDFVSTHCPKELPLPFGAVTKALLLVQWSTGQRTRRLEGAVDNSATSGLRQQSSRPWTEELRVPSLCSCTLFCAKGIRFSFSHSLSTASLACGICTAS